MDQPKTKANRGAKKSPVEALALAIAFFEQELEEARTGPKEWRIEVKETIHVLTELKEREAGPLPTVGVPVEPLSSNFGMVNGEAW